MESRYGVDFDPFTRHLDPLRDTDDDWVIDIDGFRQRSTVVDYLRERAASRQPAFVLVIGSSGSGRSTVARYLARQWFELTQSASPPLFAKQLVKDGHDEQQLVDWMCELDIRLNEIEDTSTLAPRFQQIQNAEYKNVHNQCRRTLTAVRDFLGKERSYVAYFSEIRTKSLLDLVTRVFADAPALVVLTAGPRYELAPGSVDRLASPVRTIRLDNLTAADAQTISEDRWRRASAHPPPFDGQALGKAFDDLRLPVAGVLLRVSQLLQLKAADAPGSGAWPQEQSLRLSEREIAQKLRILETRQL